MNTTYFPNKLTLIITLIFIALATLVTLPHSVAALSCMNPADMLDTYAVEPEYVVVLVEAGTVETEGNEHDQMITVQKVYKGELANTDTVTFNFNETWSYLCVGGPAEVGTEALYVLRDQQAVQVFATDSELAQNLLAAIGTPEAPAPEEIEKKELMEQIIVLLRQLIFLLAPESTVEPTPIDTTVTTDYIGLTTKEAKDTAENNGVSFRIGMVDGEPLAVTMDYRPGRITAQVEDDVVVGYTVE